MCPKCYNLSMKGLTKNSSTLLEIKKSKFYCFGYIVHSVEEVDKIISQLHKQYVDATHICYAYVIASPNKERAVDDGEPEGTAGKPILDVIKKKQLSNVLLVVVRYFGGVKLGAGGLVRAYSQGASLAVDAAGISDYDVANYYSAILPISIAKEFNNYLNSVGANVESIVYAEQVIIKFSIFGEVEYTGVTLKLLDSKLTKKE